MPSEPPSARLASARAYLEEQGQTKHPVYGFLLRYAEQLDEAIRDEDYLRINGLIHQGPTPDPSEGEDCDPPTMEEFMDHAPTPEAEAEITAGVEWAGEDAEDDGRGEDCTCPRLVDGSHGWDPICPRHGTDRSEWCAYEDHVPGRQHYGFTDRGGRKRLCRKCEAPLEIHEDDGGKYTEGWHGEKTDRAGPTHSDADPSGVKKVMGEEATVQKKIMSPREFREKCADLRLYGAEDETGDPRAADKLAMSHEALRDRFARQKNGIKVARGKLAAIKLGVGDPERLISDARAALDRALDQRADHSDEGDEGEDG